MIIRMTVQNLLFGKNKRFNIKGCGYLSKIVISVIVESLLIYYL